VKDTEGILVYIKLMMMSQPYILDETEDFAVVFKPPGMHCAPLSQKDGGTLLEWFALQCPAYDVELMHRLDFETHGLVLFAKNPESYKFFKSLQDKGEFIKEYSAICTDSTSEDTVPGFPPIPYCYAAAHPLPALYFPPFIVESYFRPYGPGRKLVRPVIDDGKKLKEIASDKGGFYKTEITGISGYLFTVRLKRGFRHQIRCHLSWIGCPILNDPLYPRPAEKTTENGLALRAHGLFFADLSGRRREYRIVPLNCDIRY